MYSPQFPRFSPPAVSLSIKENRAPEAAWADYQFWVWPYTWRKTSTNVTVLNPGSRAPSPSATPPFETPSAEPAPPPVKPVESPRATPPAAENLLDSGGTLVEPPREPAHVETPAPAVSPAEAATIAPAAGNYGSLVWKIPAMRKGG